MPTRQQFDNKIPHRHTRWGFVFQENRSLLRLDQLDVEVDVDVLAYRDAAGLKGRVVDKLAQRILSLNKERSTGAFMDTGYVTSNRRWVIRSR